MADFGRVSRAWLTTIAPLAWPSQKGVVHLALASITNACFDFWAKSRGKTSMEIASRPDPQRSRSSSGLELRGRGLERTRRPRNAAGPAGNPGPAYSDFAECYPGYDTSVGWMAYDDQKVQGPDPACSRLWLSELSN